MATKITTWRPDTCGCVILYQWDDAVPDDQLVHTVYQISKKCSFHQNTLSNGEHFTVVQDENTRKNRAIGKILADFPALTEQVTIDGETLTRMKRGVMSWSFDDTRKLILDAHGNLSVGEKIVVRAALNNMFGAGKADIV